MKTSERGVALIRNEEGCVLTAYRDAIGIPTIGVGHTYEVKMGDEISQEQADEFLRQDLAHTEKAINDLVKVPLNQNQFDSLVSFAFNVGTKAFEDSTLLKFLNAGDYENAAAEFPRWNHAGGKVLSGLTKRRLRERLLFLEQTEETT